MKKVLILISLLFLVACQSTPDAPVDADPAPAAEASSQSSGSEDSSSSKELMLSVPGMAASQAVTIGEGAEIKIGDWATRWELEKLEVYQGETKKAVGKHKKEGRWYVEDSSGKQLAKIKARDDGGYKVVDSNEKMICKVKKRDDGFKVVDSDEETVLVKVKIKDGKIKVKNGKEETLAKIKGQHDASLITWLFIEKLPLEVRLAAASLTLGSP